MMHTGVLVYAQNMMDAYCACRHAVPTVAQDE